MVEVQVESVRISLVSQHRILMLKDKENGSERQIAIPIGPFEADAITLSMQELTVQRPVTHDLLKDLIREMGGILSHILVNSFSDGVFYSSLFIKMGGNLLEVDCRTSDAIALSVRANCPIFVSEDIMKNNSIIPELGQSDEST